VFISNTEINLAKEKIAKFKEKNKTYLYSSEKLSSIHFSIQNTYFLLYCILPFLETQTFYTRKYQYFQL
jgi:hypothetical protein